MARLIYGKSVKGATHVRNGMPCQDSYRIDKISDDLSILAVADGHGSEKSPRSKSGSMIAVNVFYSVMRKYLLNYRDSLDALVTYLNRDGQLKFAQDICEEWQRRVREAFYKSKTEKPLDENGAVKWPDVYRLYGTTLLGLLVTKAFVFAFQIGDGDIVLVDQDSISPVVETEKILGTETHSLSKVDAWKNAVSVVRRRDAQADTPYLYMMSTDGFVNSYATEKDYQKSCRDYFNMIGQYGFDTVSGNMGKWLTETSELGCGDDITLVLCYVSAVNEANEAEAADLTADKVKSASSAADENGSETSVVNEIKSASSSGISETESSPEA